MGALPQALEIIFEVQRKRVMKLIFFLKAFQLTKQVFFFISLDPSYFQTS